MVEKDSVVYSSVAEALKSDHCKAGYLFCVMESSDSVTYYRKDSDTAATYIPDLLAYLTGISNVRDIPVPPIAPVAPDNAFYTVPFEPTENQWNGLARAIVMWLDMEPKTPRALFKHLERCGRKIPQWLRDEPDMKNLDKVPPKGTRAAIIYKAMLEGYTEGGDSDEEDT